jgi:hypothetical protein
VREGSNNIVFKVEPKVLGIVGVNGATNYGVLLALV